MHTYQFSKVQTLVGGIAVAAFIAVAALVAPTVYATVGGNATVVATKIVCDNESDLPNWGAGTGPDITSTTASAYVAAHPGCHLQEGWTFQWVKNSDSSTNPGDNNPVAAAAPWTTLAATNGSGSVTATIPVPSGSDKKVWFREVVPATYIGFSGDITAPVDQDVSAEIYCDTDHLNYDNWDWINPVVAGHTYYCVAWNVQRTGTLTIVKNTVGGNGSFDFMVSATNESTTTSRTIETANYTGSKVITLPIGSYNVSEVAAEGWDTVSDCESAVLVTEGQNVTCTFTNTLDHGMLTIKKEVIGGGPSAESDFHFTVPAAQAQVVLADGEDETIEVPNGAYAVTETEADQSNYDTEYSEDCTGEIGPGETKVCVVTNTYNPPEQCTPNAPLVIVSDTQTTKNGNPTVLVGGTGAHPEINDRWTAVIDSGAKWVWGEDTYPRDTDLVETFVRHFTITGNPTNGSSLDIAADNGYSVTVNGQDIGCADPEEFNYQAPNTPENNTIHDGQDTCAVPASVLHTGDNYITFVVNNMGREGAEAPSNPAGLMYKLTINSETCPDNQCVTPNSDVTTPFSFGSSNEPSLQNIFTSNGYPTLSATNDNKDTTSWNGNGSTANFIAKFVKRYAGNATVFGYFANGSSTFVPLFKEGSHPNYVATPTLADGATMPFSIPALTSVVFGIDTWNGASKVFTTDPANTNNTDGGDDHATVYHPSTNEYVMGFEDLTLSGADKDYNDMTVSVSAESCEVPPTTAKILAQKIVCDAESYLPNWGNGQETQMIDEDTAANFLAEGTNAQHCHLEDWTFEYAPDGTDNPGDGVGVAGGDWTPFAAGTPISVNPTNLLWVREQFDTDYVPFTGTNTTQSVSAEIYCSDDVLHYDNYDYIAPVKAGNTYYCVAFNAPKPDSQIDCNLNTHHIVGNECVLNETTPTSTTQCSDAVDNDGDGLNNAADPGCHSDGNVGYPASYVPGDDNETDDSPASTGGGGGSGGAGNGLFVSGGGAGGGIIPQVLGASCGLAMNQHLRFGGKNRVDQVKILQGILNKYLPGTNLPITGFFGPLTEAAVKAFQQKYAENILTPWGEKTPTGLVYLRTLWWINHLECPDLAGNPPGNLIPWSQNPHAQD